MKDLTSEELRVLGREACDSFRAFRLSIESIQNLMILC